MEKLFLLFSLIVHSSFSFADNTDIAPLSSFGHNPGELKAHLYTPKAQHDALVVLLHGCGQDAVTFAKQSGFLAQAKLKGFALLLPEQQNSNNAKLCFNWYNKNDHQAKSGENLSLFNMISSVKKSHKIKNTFIAGLSAGGAMTSIMLVHYPELFDSGAVIAGLPYPCADDLQQALSCMQQGAPPSLLTSIIKETKNTKKDWPQLTIWVGNQDKIVNPINSHQLANQWLELTGASSKSTQVMTKNPDLEIKNWSGLNKTIQLQLVEFKSLGHGIPVKPELKGGGTSGPFLLSAPLSAAITLTKFWQLSS